MKQEAVRPAADSIGSAATGFAVNAADAKPHAILCFMFVVQSLFMAARRIYENDCHSHR